MRKRESEWEKEQKHFLVNLVLIGGGVLLCNILLLFLVLAGALEMVKIFFGL